MHHINLTGTHYNGTLGRAYQPSSSCAGRPGARGLTSAEEIAAEEVLEGLPLVLREGVGTVVVVSLAHRTQYDTHDTVKAMERCSSSPKAE